MVKNDMVYFVANDVDNFLRGELAKKERIRFKYRGECVKLNSCDRI
jgi:hypothetical protein